jgi:hypothetical protein
LIGVSSDASTGSRPASARYSTDPVVAGHAEKGEIRASR